MTEKYDQIITELESQYPDGQWTYDQVLEVAKELDITSLPLCDMLNLGLMPGGYPYTMNDPDKDE